MEVTEMDKITDKTAEYICDNLCKYSANSELSQDELDVICADCKMGKFVCDILNAYNALNDFEKSQTYILLEKYAGFIRCKDCAHCETDFKGTTWCKKSDGIFCQVRENDGCSRGKLKTNVEKEISEKVYEMVSDSDTKGVENG